MGEVANANSAVPICWNEEYEQYQAARSQGGQQPQKAEEGKEGEEDKYGQLVDRYEGNCCESIRGGCGLFHRGGYSFAAIVEATRHGRMGESCMRVSFCSSIWWPVFLLILYYILGE